MLRIPLSPITSPWLLQWLPLIGIVTVIAHYFWFLQSHAANIPFHDDISDFILFINTVESADSMMDAFKAGFQQYNDHRVGATRLLVYATYLIQGEVNFRTLTLLANLALPLVLVLFYLCVRHDPYRLVYLLVSTLLLVNLKFYTIAFMSQAAFAYYFVFLYGFAGLITLHQVTKLKFVLAVVLCTLSSFTLASGQVVWALGLASLLSQCLLSEGKSRWYLLAWSLITAVMLLVWRVGFVVNEFEVPAEQIRVALPDYLGDAPLIQTLPRYAIFFLAFAGSALINFSVFWAVVAGSTMLLLLAYLSFRSIQDNDVRLALCCWLAVATLAAASVGRALLVAPDTILHARYNFFSVMLVCPLALLTLSKLAAFRTYVAYLAVLLALAYSVSSWRYSEGLLQKELDRLYHGFNLGRYPVAGMGEKADAIVHHAISNGVYKPPCRPFPQCKAGSTHDKSH